MKHPTETSKAGAPQPSKQWKMRVVDAEGKLIGSYKPRRIRLMTQQGYGTAITLGDGAKVFRVNASGKEFLASQAPFADLIANRTCTTAITG